MSNSNVGPSRQFQPDAEDIAIAEFEQAQREGRHGWMALLAGEFDGTPYATMKFVSSREEIPSGMAVMKVWPGTPERPPGFEHYPEIRKEEEGE